MLSVPLMPDLHELIQLQATVAHGLPYNFVNSTTFKRFKHYYAYPVFVCFS